MLNSFFRFNFFFRNCPCVPENPLGGVVPSYSSWHWFWLSGGYTCREDLGPLACFVAKSAGKLALDRLLLPYLLSLQLVLVPIEEQTCCSTPVGWALIFTWLSEKSKQYFDLDSFSRDWTVHIYRSSIELGPNTPIPMPSKNFNPSVSIVWPEFLGSLVYDKAPHQRG